LLSSKHEKEWLKLGIIELRRIAALHGIVPIRAEPMAGLNMDARE
jgi:hypothetical protein